jgi:vacuolar-type H+-ATPase subunit B/Vma2
VEGDDHNEPVADAVRGILDGHVVLDRAIAERGRYPAINILRSVSRTMPDCNTLEENEIVNKARKYMATYEDMAELIRLGAYRRGSDGAVDESINYYPGIEKFLAQNIDETSPLASCYEQLRTILNMPAEGTNRIDVPVSLEPKPIEPQAQATETSIQSSETVNEPDQPISEQTLSLDTLSELNSLGE